MTTTPQEFSQLVAELVSRIEAARVECQRMRTLLSREHAALDTFERTAKPFKEGIVVDAAARFAARQTTANAGL